VDFSSGRREAGYPCLPLLAGEEEEEVWKEGKEEEEEEEK